MLHTAIDAGCDHLQKPRRLDREIAGLLLMLRRAKLLLQNAQFLLWKRRHPLADFKDYFLEIAQSHLARGLSHPTLGHNLSGGAFATSGQKTFPSLARRYGIEPDDTCVDYGCGTLRVGVHAIRYLNPSRYWGMDISTFFLAQGLELIGNELALKKFPNLRVISPATIAEAAAAKPKFLFSVNVLLHIHPSEISEFFANILSIIRCNGLAVVAGQWTEGRTIQVARQSWIHSEADLRKAVQSAGGHAIFVTRSSYGRRIRGLMEVRQNAAAAAG
jgi:hypothetical protein